MLTVDDVLDDAMTNARSLMFLDPTHERARRRADTVALYLGRTVEHRLRGAGLERLLLTSGTVIRFASAGSRYAGVRGHSLDYVLASEDIEKLQHDDIAPALAARAGKLLTIAAL